MSNSNDFRDRRATQRTNMWNVVAKVSTDRWHWISVIIPNISAGGLMFATDKHFDLGDRLWFELEIDPVLPSIEQFNFKVQCEIKNKREMEGGINGYGVIFCDISNANCAQLKDLIDRTVLVYGNCEK